MQRFSNDFKRFHQDYWEISENIARVFKWSHSYSDYFYFCGKNTYTRTWNSENYCLFSEISSLPIIIQIAQEFAAIRFQNVARVFKLFHSYSDHLYFYAKKKKKKPILQLEILEIMISLLKDLVCLL